MDWNHYYEVVEPLFYLERKGSSPSNTWVGRSQAFDTIFAGRQARPGDQFHLLVGGDFLVRDSKATASVNFWLPKHIFEKSYGGSNTSKSLFKDLEKQGTVKRIQAPEMKLDYAGARSEKEFPGSEPRLKYEENSPTAVSLCNRGSYIASMAREHEMKPIFFDFQEERRARLQITRQEQTGHHVVLDIQVTEDGWVYVKPSKTAVDVPSFMEAVRDLPDVDPQRIYEESFWAKSIDILEDEDFLNELEGKFLAAANKAAALAKP